MGAYRYEAVDAGGRKRRGVVEADTARRARREVAGTGLTLLSLTEAGEAKATRTGRGPRAARPKEVIATTRQLATLVNASLPVEEALAAVAAQEEGTAAGRTLTTVRTRVVEGWRLSDALGEHPKAFSSLYRGVVAAGEASGTLGPVLLSLATMMERNRAIASKAIMALIYPAVIAVVAVFIVAALMVFVVPPMAETYEDMGATLPALTRGVIGTSSFLASYGGFILLALGAGIAAFVFARRRPGPRRAIDRAILRLPLFGRLSRDLDAARFSRTLATLFGSGTPLLDALQGARRTVVNTHVNAELDRTLTAVREGSSLAGGLKRAEVFPPMLASMVAAGERSGTLPEMLERTADQMEAGFEAATTVALRLLEPAVIVTLGVVVLVIVLAIMLPIVNLTTMPLG